MESEKHTMESEKPKYKWLSLENVQAGNYTLESSHQLRVGGGSLIELQPGAPITVKANYATERDGYIEVEIPGVASLRLAKEDFFEIALSPR